MGDFRADFNSSKNLFVPDFGVVAGIPGPKGDPGITPSIGENGNWYLENQDTGKPSRGEQGQKGEKGDPGDTGPAGRDGADGKSAYQAAVDGGYTGTETQFNAELAKEHYSKTEEDALLLDKQDVITDLSHIRSGAAAGAAAIPAAEKGVANGVAELDDSGKIPAGQLPSYVNIATASSAGIVKPSSDFDISADGTLSLYKQIAISSVTVRPNVVEIGTTVDDVLVSWAVNKQPVSQTVNGEDVGTSVRSKEFTNLGLISRTVFTVSVADARTEKTGSAAVEFYNSVFYGAAEEWDRSAMTGNVRASNLGSFIVNAGADDYIWYAIPATYPTPRFFVGGFEGGFSLYATQNVTNASGYTESFKIFRSDNKALGQTTVTLS